MLSSVSLFVCALVCGVFWRVYIYQAWKSRSFTSVSLFRVRDLFYFFLLLLIFLFGACLSFFLFFFLVDVFKSALRSNLRAAIPPDDHHLTALADFLPAVTLAGRTTSTITKYSATYARWKLWACDHDLPAFPASPYHFALCFRHFMADAKTPSPIECAVEPSLSEQPLVRMFSLLHSVFWPTILPKDTPLTFLSWNN